MEKRHALVSVLFAELISAVSPPGSAQEMSAGPSNLPIEAAPASAGSPPPKVKLAQPAKQVSSRGRRNSRTKRPLPTSGPTRKELLTVTLPVVPPPDLIPQPESEKQTSEARAKPKAHVDSEGLVVGDFHIAPTITFGTDGHLDDVNSRERVARETIEELERRRSGVIHTDPLSALFQQRQNDRLRPGDPGYRLAWTVRQLVQGALHFPVSLKVNPDPQYSPSQYSPYSVKPQP